MKWLILVVGVVANASASILVKVAIMPPRSFPSLRDLSTLMNLPFWSGVALYGATFLIYAVALSKMPLNVVHPVLTSGAIALVALSSFLIFRETFYWTTIVGIMLVVIGVFLITVKAT